MHWLHVLLYLIRRVLFITTQLALKVPGQTASSWRLRAARLCSNWENFLRHRLSVEGQGDRLPWAVGVSVLGSHIILGDVGSPLDELPLRLCHEQGEGGSWQLLKFSIWGGWPCLGRRSRWCWVCLLGVKLRRTRSQVGIPAGVSQSQSRLPHSIELGGGSLGGAMVRAPDKLDSLQSWREHREDSRNSLEDKEIQ